MNIYDKYKVDEETFRLICIATVWKTKYTERGIEQAKLELAKRGISPDQYGDDFYIDVVSSQEKGWSNLIREMFRELKIAGWSCEIPINYKEKYGKLQFVVEIDNQQMHEIVEKYLARINNSCMLCGDQGEAVSIMGSDSIYCSTHYIKLCHKVENINDFGFTVHGERFYWAEVVSINGFNSYHGDCPIENSEDFIERIEIKLKDGSSHPRYDFNCITLHYQYINWYLFLYKIPKFLLPPFLSQYLQTFFDNLAVCKVCGMKAVRLNDCLYCNSRPWEVIGQKHKEKWASRNFLEYDYVKDEQLRFYSMGSFYEKKKLEEFFEINEDHKLLFSEEELIEEKQASYDYNRSSFDPASKDRLEQYNRKKRLELEQRRGKHS